MKEEKIKHLEFIQNIITRHNTNSFQIKGLCITVVSAILAVYASNNNIEFLWIGIVPTILLWFWIATIYNKKESSEDSIMTLLV